MSTPLLLRNTPIMVRDFDHCPTRQALQVEYLVFSLKCRGHSSVPLNADFRPELQRAAYP